MRRAALFILCLLAAGCGGGGERGGERVTTTSTRDAPQRATAASGDVGVAVLGKSAARLTDLAPSGLESAQLVVVGPEARGVRRLARAHPGTHFVLVGRPFDTARAPNVAGLLFRDDEAAYLAGAVGVLVTNDEGALEPTVAWVGTTGRKHVVDAFERGAQSIDPNVRVVRAFSHASASRCKEAALEAIGHGASVVFAGSGPCVAGARSAAADRNAVVLALADFERASVAVDRFVDDARKGLFHGGENIVFGAASGAVGVGPLDSRITSATVARAREIEGELATGLRSPR